MNPLKQRRGLLVPVAGLLAIALVVAVVMGSQEFTPGPVEAAHVIPGAVSGNGEQPVGVHGNPACSDVLPGAFLFSHKTGVPQDETIPLSFNGLTGTLTIDVTNSTFNFSFTGDFVAVGVIVKGGPNANFYDYRPNGEDADTGLHAPVNPNNNQFFGLSHIEFCIIEAAGDVSVEKTPDGDTADAGEDITFSIEVTSNGPGTATNVTLSDNLPDSGLNWTETSDPSGSCEVTGAPGSQVLSCDFGDLDPLTVRTVAVTSPTGSDDCGLVNNTATVSADNDSDSTNNNDDGDITINCPDVRVEKTPETGTVDAGQDAVFTIVVTNLGPGQSDIVTLSDTLPNAGLSWTLGGPDAADCAITGAVGSQVLDCDFGTLEEGDVRTITLTSPTDAADCGIIRNTVTISADGDIEPSNNTDTGNIEVRCGAVLINKLAKVPGDGTKPLVDVGFTINLPNGGAAVTNEEFTDNTGAVCFDGLAPGSYDAVETSPPAGYKGADPTGVTVVGGTDCSINEPTPVEIENTPLTDISIDVTAQTSGATNSTIECFEGVLDGTSTDPANTGPAADPASLDIVDLEPGTYICRIIIDP